MIATPAPSDPTSRPPEAGDGSHMRMVHASRAIASGVRRRLTLGDITVEVSVQEGREPAPIAVEPHMVLVVFAGEGQADLMGEGLGSIAPGGAVVLAKAEPFSIGWRSVAGGAAVHVPKSRFQVLIGRRLGAPVRIGAGQIALAGLSGDTPLGALVVELAREARAPWALTEARTHDLGRCLLEGLAEALGSQPMKGAVVLPARSVARAMGHIQERLAANAEIHPAMIAAVAGVTPRTLRDGFRACLGVSISAFIQTARLERARAQLGSGRDVRAMQDVARETGFKSASAFARAYVRVFGEVPTETRARGVRSAGVS